MDTLDELGLCRETIKKLKRDNGVLSQQNNALKLLVAEYEERKAIAPLNSLGLNPKTIVALESEGIFTVDALLKCSAEELRDRAGINQSGLNRINQRLKLYLFPKLKP